MLNIATDESKVIIFPARMRKTNAGRVLFLLSVRQVVDVLKTSAVCPVPFAPAFLEGVTLWQEQVVPVISLETCLGYTPMEMNGGTRVLIVKAPAGHQSNSPMLLGAIRVAPAMRMQPTPNLHEPVAQSLWPQQSQYVRGVYAWKRGIIAVADMNRILNGVQGDMPEDSAVVVPDAVERRIRVS